MKHNSILKLPDIGIKLIKELSKYVELPSDGFAAGGAIGNILLSWTHGGEALVNDVDVFRVLHTDGLIVDSMPHRHIALRPSCYIDYDPDRYMQLCIDAVDNKDRAYTVGLCERKGLLNTVSVELAANHGTIENYRTILQGFDLNCCQVGIDLASQQLVFEPGFEAFLNTMQLNVAYPHTPFHTAIRLVKKVKELRCYCDYDSQLKYLSQVDLRLSKELSKHPLRRESSLYSNKYGLKYHNMYLEHKDVLDKYFIEEMYDQRLFKTTKLVNSDLFTLRTLVACDNMYWDCSTPSMIKAKWDLLHNGNDAAIRKSMHALSYSDTTKSLALSIPGFAQCDWHEKHLGRIEKYVLAHPVMSTLFYELNLNISQQLTAIRVIDKMVEKEGPVVIGLIEHYKQLPSDGINENWIMGLVQDYKMQYQGKLKEEEDLSHFQYRDAVREMVSIDALLKEGQEMGHCVGGYGSAVKNGSLIFHIQKDGEHSTLHVSKSCTRDGDILDIGFRHREHRGKYNTKPCKSHSDIASALIRYLTAEYKKENTRDTFTSRSRPVTIPFRPRAVAVPRQPIPLPPPEAVLRQPVPAQQNCALTMDDIFTMLETNRQP